MSEEDEGFVIVASEDIDLTVFEEAVRGFAVEVNGTATVASVHRLGDQPDDQNSRLRRMLSEELFQLWPQIQNDQTYIVDVGIACAPGANETPTRPGRGEPYL